MQEIFFNANLLKTFLVALLMFLDCGQSRCGFRPSGSKSGKPGFLPVGSKPGSHVPHIASTSLVASTPHVASTPPVPTMLESQPLTAKQKALIVLTHNTMRSKVKPPAAQGAMKTIVWDSDVEAYALNWSKCHSYGTHRNEVNQNTLNMGENLFMADEFHRKAFDVTEELEAAMRAWNDEHISYDYEENTCTPCKKCTKDCGHYTQVVWQDSSSIGCGYVLNCPNGPGERNIMIVCNYNPVGNCWNQRPYSSGKYIGGDSKPCTGQGPASCRGTRAPSIQNFSRSPDNLTLNVAVDFGCCNSAPFDTITINMFETIEQYGLVDVGVLATTESKVLGTRWYNTTDMVSSAFHVLPDYAHVDLSSSPCLGKMYTDTKRLPHSKKANTSQGTN